MTPAERALRDRVARRARLLEPRLVQRQLRAFDLIRSLLTGREFLEAIARGSVDLLLSDILSGSAFDRPFEPFRVLLDQAVIQAGESFTDTLPKAYQAGTFDMLNPRVVDAARALDTRVVSALQDEIRETFTQHVVRGVEEGRGPRVIARGVREVVGLAPNQEAAVANFERMLRAGDREALTRELRDKRFDRTLQRALGARGDGLSEEQIQRMTAAYRRRMIAWNAETHARSAALDAQRLGQRMSWQDAIDKGLIDVRRVRRTWVDSDDSRVRPEHRAMDGETIRFGDTYSNGQTVPGDTDYNCRCVERYWIARGDAVDLAA